MKDLTKKQPAYIVTGKMCKKDRRQTAMEHLIFSLNATMPIFFLMVLGACFRKAGIMEGVFVDRVNQFVFKVALPVLLFE